MLTEVQEVKEENPTSHTYVVEKREKYFNSLSDNYGYSSLILQEPLQALIS